MAGDDGGSRRGLQLAGTGGRAKPTSRERRSRRWSRPVAAAPKSRPRPWPSSTPRSSRRRLRREPRDRSRIERRLDRLGGPGHLGLGRRSRNLAHRRCGLASEEPLDYMESMQQPDGHIRWRASSDLNGIWMTAYALPAFTGQVMPYPLVPPSGSTGDAAAELPGGRRGAGSVGGERRGRRWERMHPAASGRTEGERRSHRRPAPGPAGAPSGGVGAGGGGEGAPDFSRPQPGSKGKTPGGARDRPPRAGPRSDRPLAQPPRLEPAPGDRGPRPPNRGATRSRPGSRGGEGARHRRPARRAGRGGNGRPRDGRRARSDGRAPGGPPCPRPERPRGQRAS